jgi:hypothetical protein
MKDGSMSFGPYTHVLLTSICERGLWSINVYVQTIFTTPFLQYISDRRTTAPSSRLLRQGQHLGSQECGLRLQDQHAANDVDTRIDVYSRILAYQCRTASRPERFGRPVCEQ